MTMKNTEKMKRVVETVVAEQFRDLRIVDINIRPEIDDDGDLYFFTRVIFDAKANWPETEIRVGLIRHVLPEMEKMEIDGFPIISFVPDSAYRRLIAETI